jgi:hypothetical protein
MTSSVLSEKEISDYRQNGYVVPSFTLPADMINALQTTLQQLIDANPGVRP